MQSWQISLVVLSILVLVGIFIGMMVWIFYDPPEQVPEEVIVTVQKLGVIQTELRTEPSPKALEAALTGIPSPKFEFVQSFYGDEKEQHTQHVFFNPETNHGGMILRTIGGHCVEWFTIRESTVTPQDQTEFCFHECLRLNDPPLNEEVLQVVSSVSDSHELMVVASTSGDSSSWLRLWGWKDHDRKWVEFGLIRYPRHRVRSIHLESHFLVVHMDHHLLVYHMDNQGHVRRLENQYEKRKIIHMVGNGNQLGISLGDGEHGAERVQYLVLSHDGHFHKSTKVPLYNFEQARDACVLKAFGRDHERAMLMTHEEILLVYQNNSLSQIFPMFYQIKEILGSPFLHFAVMLTESFVEDHVEGECRIVSVKDELYDLTHSELLWNYRNISHHIGPLCWFHDRYLLFLSETKVGEGCVYVYQWIL